MNYYFLPKLCEEFDFDIIRMENLIAVYDNEAEPIDEVLDAVIDAYRQCAKVTDKQLADWSFNDEIISLAWDKAYFSRSQYADINNKETADEPAEPFLLKPENNNGKGVLLIHGLLASPAEIKEYAQELVKQGYIVLGIRLKGHGTSPYDLRERTYEDWYESAERGMKIMRVYCDTIAVIGFSTGGSLALKLAAENSDKIIAVVAVAVPMEYVDKYFSLIPLLHGSNRLVNWVSSMEGVKPFIENDSEHKTINYKNVPVKSLFELRRLTSNINELFPKITIPTLIIYGDEDPVVHTESADIIMGSLGCKIKELIMIHSDRHGMLMENIGGIWESINKFLKKIEKLT